MCPGDLKHRITIETRAQADDGVGGFAETWSTFATLWSSIVPMRGTERFASEKLEHDVTHKITIRFRDDITTAMRISYETRIFKILGAIDLKEEKRWLELSCEEGSGS